MTLFIFLLFFALKAMSENTNISTLAESFPGFKMPSKEEMQIQGENNQLMMSLQKHKDFPSMWGPMDGSTGYQIPGYEEEKKKSVVSTYGNVVNYLVSKLPDSALRNGLTKYFEIINTEAYQGSDQFVGATNAGLSSHGAKVVEKNLCFSKIAEGFYDELRRQDEKINPQKNIEDFLKPFKPFEPINPLNGRPTLAEESGSGRFKDLEPGWLFKKAMKYSGGDSGLAMRLISLCGHDDVSQGHFNYKHEADDKEEILAKYLRSLDAHIKQQQDMLEILRPATFPLLVKPLPGF